MSLLAELLTCVHDEYFADATKAGVVLSQLSHTEHYASVCRYTAAGAKVVVCSAKAASLDASIRALAVAWMLQVKRFEALRARLAGPKAFDALLVKALRGAA